VTKLGLAKTKIKKERQLKKIKEESVCVKNQKKMTSADNLVVLSFVKKLWEMDSPFPARIFSRFILFNSN